MSNKEFQRGTLLYSKTFFKGLAFYSPVCSSFRLCQSSLPACLYLLSSSVYLNLLSLSSVSLYHFSLSVCLSVSISLPLSDFAVCIIYSFCSHHIRLSVCISLLCMYQSTLFVSVYSVCISQLCLYQTNLDM